MTYLKINASSYTYVSGLYSFLCEAIIKYANTEGFCKASHNYTNHIFCNASTHQCFVEQRLVSSMWGLDHFYQPLNQ